MPSTQSTPLVSRARLGTALLVAVLTLAFNYGTAVTTLTDAGLWLAIGVAVAYPTLTVMGLLADHIW
jgi:hypothetical protein